MALVNSNRENKHIIKQQARNAYLTLCRCFMNKKAVCMGGKASTVSKQTNRESYESSEFLFEKALT
ncbi:CLUMA_CG001873, isoform A [Clunio marinus]|uniref:CLUMA_CG001873, isoform A n=1 Tax=Clunio marinus TaxID=568069 RepID=A0A1J1HJ61_9DIPT|nr:CLUMA_CG001873, isoform A [Clunio marinus]